jgi:hypothetical protein
MALPKKNIAYSFVISLVDQANRPQFKSTPTLAAGDFKVSTDGAALANLTTLPTNTPASSVCVLVSLSASEMNGDRIVVVGKDAAGAEWDDLTIYIDTTAVTVDDLVRSTTPANTLDVTGGKASSNILQINSVTSAATNLSKSADTMIQCAVDASPAPTTTQFADATNLSSTVDNFYKNRVIIFTSGTLNKQVTQITVYTGSTHVVTVSPALTSAPSAADTFIVI